jgi:hypothetical protein
MTDLSAQHYLGIYQTRLKMAEKGTIHPKPEVVAGMRQLITGLSAMPSDAKVRLEIQDGKTRFRAASTGDLLVEFDFKDDA